MNILYLTTGRYTTINNKGIYPDLLREFIKNGHEIYMVASIVDGKEKFQLIEEPNFHLLRVKTGKIVKTNIVEKSINTLLIERRYLNAIKKHFQDVTFDLVLYPTPPITFLKVVEYIKNRDGAKSYLMLRDIFPQNAVDIGMMSKSGVKGYIYRYFRRVEKMLYEISDHIGCMSQANLDYLLKHNPEIEPGKVEICPNSIEIEDMSVTSEERVQIRNKYDIPLDKKVYVYGGNLGKPQGIPFLIKCLSETQHMEDAFFLIVGDGTEFSKIEAYISEARQKNVKLMKRLPKEDYETMVGACDVGMIFLDHRFTIPNFPSRLLSYMQAKIPVFAVTDPNTDVGEVIIHGGFGWWCESNSTEDFAKNVKKINESNLEEMRDREFKYLIDHYSVDRTYEIIAKSAGLE